MGKKTDNIFYYFSNEWKILLIITISGLLYNIGLVCVPWFEGRLAGCLMDILNNTSTFNKMLILVTCYIITIFCVQGSRYVKRFYVRRFSNNVNKKMKSILYSNLISLNKSELEHEGFGELITKAISDVDDCAEGMRKFTTEIFDTGVALAGYVCLLLYYDIRLALLCLIFPPISYIIAEKMKSVVQKSNSDFKKKNSLLNSVTMDCITNAITYRIYGCESERKEYYEHVLAEYGHAAVLSDIWANAMPPLYNIISMASVLFIIYFGAANISGNGWSTWNIAAFTTFISCYTKLSVKSSKAAKLFNSVHKAQVSWKRIKPMMSENNICVNSSTALETDSDMHTGLKNSLIIKDDDFSIDVSSGDIIGITGPVASGKSTFGRQFLCEGYQGINEHTGTKKAPYPGSITYNGTELYKFPDVIRHNIIGYMGHEPELLNDTIYNNITLGDNSDINHILELVCFKSEVDSMEHKQNTLIGNGGIRLSGGQAQRTALARTLYNKRPVIILDDPFSALDKATEEKIFKNIKTHCPDSIIFIISHRLYLFPYMNKVIWIENGKKTVGTHNELISNNYLYKKLFDEQKDGE